MLRSRHEFSFPSHPTWDFFSFHMLPKVSALQCLSYKMAFCLHFEIGKCMLQGAWLAEAGSESGGGGSPALGSMWRLLIQRPWTPVGVRVRWDGHPSWRRSSSVHRVWPLMTRPCVTSSTLSWPRFASRFRGQQRRFSILVVPV